MNKLSLSAFILVLLVAATPATAQDVEVTDAPGDCLAEAQAWYDAIDPDETIQEDFFASVNGTRMSERVAARSRFMETLKGILELDIPPCLTSVYAIYFGGLGQMGIAMDAKFDDDNQAFFNATILGTSAISYTRGYLAHLGVVLRNPTIVGIAFK